MGVSIGWAVGLIFQAMLSGLGWFADILSSIEGANGFYIACFTVFVAVGVLLMRLRGTALEQMEDKQARQEARASRKSNGGN